MIYVPVKPETGKTPIITEDSIILSKNSFCEPGANDNTTKFSQGHVYEIITYQFSTMHATKPL